MDGDGGKFDKNSGRFLNEIPLLSPCMEAFLSSAHGKHVANRIDMRGEMGYVQFLNGT